MSKVYNPLAGISQRHRGRPTKREAFPCRHCQQPTRSDIKRHGLCYGCYVNPAVKLRYIPARKVATRYDNEKIGNEPMPVVEPGHLPCMACKKPVKCGKEFCDRAKRMGVEWTLCEECERESENHK